MLYAIRNISLPGVYLKDAHRHEGGEPSIAWTDGLGDARKFSTMGDLTLFVEDNKVEVVWAARIDPETFEFIEYVPIERKPAPAKGVET